MDDLIIFSETIEDHLRDLEKVFTISKENAIKLNLEKCHFFKDKVELLNHTVSTDGISLLSDKVKVIAQWLPQLPHHNFNLFSVLLAIIENLFLTLLQLRNPYLSC